MIRRRWNRDGGGDSRRARTNLLGFPEIPSWTGKFTARPFRAQNEDEDEKSDEEAGSRERRSKEGPELSRRKRREVRSIASLLVGESAETVRSGAETAAA